MTSTAGTTDTTTTPDAQPDAAILAAAARWLAALNDPNAGGSDEAESNRLFAITKAAEAELAEMEPQTAAGAAAQLRQVVASMELQWGVPGGYTPPLELLWLGSMAGVLAFLENRA